MGERGPIPTRSEFRRRRNAPELPTDVAPGADEVEAPEPDESWHSVALAWYVSLGQSGQSRYYEPSDWATAYLIAESMSRDLSEQVVGTTEKGDILKASIPLKGASLAAYLKAFSVLLVTEGDRRRASVELQRASGGNPDADRAAATVTQLREVISGTDG